MDAYGTFHDLVSQLDYPMFIVTVRAGQQQAGCLVGFASQCSIDPPRFLVCLSRKNHTYRVATGADAVAVHLVPRQAEALAELFGGHSGDDGGHSGDDMDKFTRCAWHPGPGGLPILQECGNWFVGRVLERFDLGDHAGFLLEPVAAHSKGGEPYFTFHQAMRMRIEPGHPA